MNPAGLLAIASLVAALAVLTDVLPLGLPYPAINERAVDVPSHLLPLVPSPLEGDYAPNTRLQGTVRLLQGVVSGPESLVVAHDGKTVIVLDKFGYAKRGSVIESTSGVPRVELEDGVFAYTGPGRPLGAEFDQGGNLVICDSLKGLVMVANGTRRLVVLANRVAEDSAIDPGSEINYANDLDIAKDGTVYFSASTDLRVAFNRDGFYDTFNTYLLDALRGKPAGRLLAYNPKERTAKVLAGGIWYANGVALAKDESFVAVVETTALRVRRHWLKGPQAGQTDVLIDALPGFPDGISRGEDGNFLIALISRPSPILKLMPFRPLRAIAAWIPPKWRPRPKPWGAVIRVSPEGKVVETHFDVEGGFMSGISGVREVGGRMFFGTLENDHIGIYDPNRRL
ncbi:unnamed protein product [Ostreobium quekettii]|uniref:Strictosidine synthase conserved region domain-containing protein n=1 Tax=Ostreobium quekettii TaxID=121088 RepID=A0A8S1JEV8_9CHLO|nr:unnamed protein product [Ostreobium quekettii]|eukprot:evm.model.scf_101EXC.4 EVM.evm.TU.scf_101EXC.4   scf_101EXC:34879-36072(-)